MYLKEIIIHGFKSFANETVLNFDKGITAIVGPNGSGKSNIADAVRWVLGERSIKQLRGSETLDVIFAGTEMRKAQAFAYVALTIDNSDKKLALDFDEVQVSRRLFRNGESEYKINGVECRLKDIYELFFDTGIGKEGYSIIGQGQIDQIISSKPEDTRELFDEAVGIVKYKKRKAIALRKLEEERNNLAKVSLVVEEIKKQIGPLKEKAEAAKKYLELHDDLILYESNYFVREVDVVANKIEELNKSIEANKDNIKLNADKRKDFADKYQEIENIITELDLKLSSLHDERTDVSLRKESYQGQVNLLKEQINQENINNESRIDRINGLSKSVDESVTKIENDVHILRTLKKQISFIRVNNIDFEDENDEFENDVNLIDNGINDDVAKIKNLMGDKYDLSLESDVESNDNIFSNESSFGANSERKKEMEEVEARIEAKSNLINTLNNKFVDTQKALENINAELEKNNNLYNLKETRLETIKDMLERYEGYNDPVKNVLDHREEFDGIKGIVADLIRTKKEYETAVETVIGGAIQNVVTDNVETSKKIITYLKTNKLGRVTTLPLDKLVVQDNDIYERAKNEWGAIDVAVNLVNYDEEYRVLAEFLLKRCVVVDTFDNAKVIFSKYNQKIKLVTLEGDLFTPGGAVAGGAYKSSLSLLGRKREYEELKVKVIEIKKEIDKLLEDKKQISIEHNKCFDDIEEAKTRLQELNIEKNTISLKIISELKLEYSNISNRAEWTVQDLHRVVGELINLWTEREKLSTSDMEYVSRIDEKQNEINTIESKISEVDVELKSLEDEIENKNQEKNKYVENRREYIDSKDRIVTEQVELEREKSNLANELEKSSARIEDVTNQMLEAYGLTYADAKTRYREDLGTNDEIKKLAKEKRKVIQDLGPIDLAAIDEYKNTFERHGIMTAQYDDVKKSEEKLALIVKDLDDNMTKQFDENFAKIKVEFNKVFKELFGGGVANLELVEVDDKDELDYGVAIVVQPPGKKLSHMVQLSGGEKALTAIALLFAIQNLKPSPFCLLDEIEAALDESNVDRFAEYLKNMTIDTQFILITHRRGTMENADRLYGITMQEKGVTSLVSVNLVEDQLT